MKIDALTYVRYNGEVYWVSRVDDERVFLRCANPRDGAGPVLKKNAVRWAGRDATGTRTLVGA